MNKVRAMFSYSQYVTPKPAKHKEWAASKIGKRSKILYKSEISSFCKKLKGVLLFPFTILWFKT